MMALEARQQLTFFEKSKYKFCEDKKTGILLEASSSLAYLTG
jgi:hypothetical protein